MKSSDISVVIQGPISEKNSNNKIGTSEICNKIRELFPESEIILSTYVNSDITGINADKIYLSQDPGAVKFAEGNEKTNNLNRMLVSSKVGVQAATRKFILKIRSDMIPSHKNFTSHWERLSVNPKNYGIFSKQVLAYPIYSLQFEGQKRKMPKPFHVSDWAFFGLSDDIKFLFDIPLVDEPYYSRYFYNHDKISFDTLPSVKWKYSPEQYLFYTALRKKYSIKFKNKQDYNKKNINISRISVFNNFLFIDPDMWGLMHSKEIYDKPLYAYDSNCYYGIIQFGVCIKERIKLGLKVTAQDVISSFFRKKYNDLLHSALR